MSTDHERASPEIKHNTYESTKDRKVGRKAIRNYAIIAGVVTLVGVGGVLTFNTLNNHNSNPANNSSQHDTQNNSEKPARESIENLTANYKFNLPNEQGIINQFEMPSGMSDQEAAETFVSRLNDWMMYGANSDFDKIANRLGDDETEEHLTGLVVGVTKDAAEPIEKALFQESQIGTYIGFVNHFQKVNTNSLNLHAKSVSKQEPYKRSIKVIDVAEGKAYSLVGDNAREVTFTVLEQANASTDNGINETDVEYADSLGKRQPVTVVFYDNGKTTTVYTIKSDWKS